MIKTFKKAISIFLIVSFVLSLVPVVSFAAADAYPWIGSNKPNFRGYRATINSDGTVTKGSKVEGEYNDFNIVLNHPGNFGKKLDDVVYKEIKGINSSRLPQNISLAAGGTDFTLSGTGTPDHDYVYEFSLCLENNASVFSTDDSVQYFKNYAQSSRNTWTDFIHITATSLKYASKQISYNFIPGRWYNFTFVVDAENNSAGTAAGYDYQAYVNGEKIISHNPKIAAYGLRTFRMGSLSYNGDLWIDNINKYSIADAHQFECPEAVSPAVTSNNPDITIDSSIDTIVVNKNHKISDLKAALSINSTISDIRYYNSDYSKQLEDTDSAIGANIVIATPRDFTIGGNTVSQENTFTYFTANKWMYKYPGINNGTIEITKETSGKSAWFSMSSLNQNLGGKGDEYLLMADSSGVSRKLTLDTAIGKQDVLEMSFYVPSASKGLSMTIRFTNLNDNATELPLRIKSDGLYTEFSGGLSKFHSLEPDKWHTFALVTPQPYDENAKENSNVCKLYINGKLVDSRGVTYTESGFRNIISMSAIGNDANHAPVIYLDNIRIHSNEYASQYDVLDYIDYKDGIDENNNIIVKGRITVGQLKAGITKKEDTNIRVYKSLTSTEVLSDGAMLEDGYVVVAAAKNDSEMERSYNYYTVKRVKNEVKVTTYVDGAVARTYGSDAQSLSVSADFYNYTNSDLFTAKMYVAQYKQGLLINLWQTDAKTIVAGEKETFTCNFEGIKDLENSNIKIMLVDENLNPYSKAATMRYKGTDSQATLYLMGDSIVQTYVNEKYPIQGWGYYIGDYLDDNITVDNRARSGWTTDHYLHPDGVYTKENGLYPVGTQLYDNKGNPKKPVGEGDRYRVWENIKKTLKAGDYVMVSLGINDSGSGNVSAERYRENIETIYNEAAVIGATVIFTTPTITGRDWNSTGGFREEYTGKGDICQAVADANNSVCLPLGAELIKTYNAMVNEYQQANPEATTVEAKNYVRNYFHLYGASSTNPPPGWNDFGSKTTDDDMHHNFVGSNKVASIIAKLLAQSDSPLGDYVVFPN